MNFEQFIHATDVLEINIRILTDAEKESADDKFLEALKSSEHCVTYLKLLCENKNDDEIIHFFQCNLFKTKDFFGELQKLDDYFSMTPPRQSPSILRYSPIPFTKSWLSLYSSRSPSRNDDASPATDAAEQKKNISKLIQNWLNFYQILATDHEATTLINGFLNVIPEAQRRFLEFEQYASHLEKIHETLDRERCSRQATPIHCPSPI